jgi:hypothetical protein
MGTPPSMQGLADTYAVVDIGGVQHIVEEGRWYTCNRLSVGFHAPSHPKGQPLLPRASLACDGPWAACAGWS